MVAAVSGGRGLLCGAGGDGFGDGPSDTALAAIVFPRAVTTGECAGDRFLLLVHPIPRRTAA